MAFTIETFLVSNDDFNYKPGASYMTSVTGSRIFNINSLVPVIQKGAGCVGVAQINELHINQYGTEVYFTFHKASDKAKEAYYNLYKNNLNLNASENEYEDSDELIIPGLSHGSGKGNKSDKKRQSYHWQ